MAVRATILPGMLAMALLAASASAADRLAIVVHPGRNLHLTTEDVAQIYLKQRRFWTNGQPILPVNREAGSRARSVFTRVVFGETAKGLAVYWNRQYFLGVLPPATLASDEAVKRFVATEPNAIGYLRVEAVDDSVSVVLTLDAPPEH